MSDPHIHSDGFAKAPNKQVKPPPARLGCSAGLFDVLLPARLLALACHRRSSSSRSCCRPSPARPSPSPAVPADVVCRVVAVCTRLHSHPPSQPRDPPRQRILDVVVPPGGYRLAKHTRQAV